MIVAVNYDIEEEIKVGLEANCGPSATPVCQETLKRLLHPGGTPLLVVRVVDNWSLGAYYRPNLYTNEHM